MIHFLLSFLILASFNRIFNHHNPPLFIIQSKWMYERNNNMYKQYQLIIEFTLSNHSHYFPSFPTLLFALLYLSTLSIS